MAGNNKLPTTTCNQARLQVFQWTRTPKNITRCISVVWGEALITGSLGQAHASVVEAIFYNAEKTTMLDEGRVEIIVDPYKVRMSVGGGKKCSYETLDKRIDEVMTALINLTIYATNQSVKAHIIEKVTLTPKAKKHNPLINTGPDKITGLNKSKDRMMWSVIISKEFMDLIRNDLALHYDPLPISQLKTGVAQAITRLIFTHSKKNQPNGGWIIDNLIIAVGAEQFMRERRRDIREDTVNLEKIGIIVDGDRMKII